MTTPKPRNTIRTYAVIVVSITSAFIMAMSYWLTKILAAPEWCARAINAEKLANPRQVTSFETCKDLLLEQVGALGINSHIYAGAIALCLLVLMVIVIAGGHISFKADKTGLSGDIGGTEKPASEAAKEVAGAAVTKAKEIVAEQALPPMEPKP